MVLLKYTADLSHLDALPNLDIIICIGMVARRLLEKRSQLFFKKLTTGDTEDELAFCKMRNRCKSEIRQWNMRKQATILDLARKNRNVLFKYMGHRRRNKPSAFSLRDRNGEPTSDLSSTEMNKAWPTGFSPLTQQTHDGDMNAMSSILVRRVRQSVLQLVFARFYLLLDAFPKHLRQENVAKEINPLMVERGLNEEPVLGSDTGFDSEEIVHPGGVVETGKSNREQVELMTTVVSLSVSEPDVLRRYCAVEYKLYTFLTTNGMATGRPVMYAFAESEQFVPMLKLFDLFKLMMKEEYPVKAFVMDKLATRMLAVFGCNVMLYYFHIRKAIRKHSKRFGNLREGNDNRTVEQRDGNCDHRVKLSGNALEEVRIRWKNQNKPRQSKILGFWHQWPQNNEDAAKRHTLLNYENRFPRVVRRRHRRRLCRV
ncbi:hypothetical protein CLF_110814 [Clonorchis sinensis]|uniref:ZSWIM1/3 RNaseH-like domain-containing protein n=1 Tax=Clonorchis sinensis TaxID=79923 RepID=G7YTX2_CLOSI|nr:hypothetical protein CLF_110814 [Clonorchis sinensis]